VQQPTEEMIELMCAKIGISREQLRAKAEQYDGKFETVEAREESLEEMTNSLTASMEVFEQSRHLMHVQAATDFLEKWNMAAEVLTMAQLTHERMSK
jgi:hypothetical protein